MLNKHLLQGELPLMGVRVMMFMVGEQISHCRWSFEHFHYAAAVGGDPIHGACQEVGCHCHALDRGLAARLCLLHTFCGVTVPLALQLCWLCRVHVLEPG